MLVAINTAQLLGAIRRDMFYFWLGAVVMTSFGTNTAACTGFQSSFQRLVELSFESLQSKFNRFYHFNLTSPLRRGGIPRVAQRTFQRRGARKRNINSDGSSQVERR